MQRFFVLRSDADYEALRACLDAARGYPNSQAEASVDPVAACERSANGAPVLALAAVLADECQEAIAEMIAAGAVTEIDRPAYEAATAKTL